MKVVLAGLFLVALISAGCEEQQMITMAQLQDYQDSVSGLIPGALSVQARTKRDFNSEKVTLKLIIGSNEYYDANPDSKQSAAIKAGEIALRVLGKGLDDGVLIITRDIREHKDEPTDGRRSDMKIDSLKQTLVAQ
jgi:hypothetical protein